MTTNSPFENGEDRLILSVMPGILIRMVACTQIGMHPLRFRSPICRSKTPTGEYNHPAMRSNFWARRRMGGLMIGAALTVLGCVLWSAGRLDSLDNLGLDIHFRLLSTIPADPRLVVVNIDDSSISAVGEWPWKRRRHAQLVSILSELGAAQIVLDLVFSDPSPPRIEPAWLGPDYDVDPPQSVRGDVGFDQPIFDDDELRDAIADSGNVYLAMFAELLPPAGTDRSAATSLRGTAHVSLLTDPPGSDQESGGGLPSERRAAVAFLADHPSADWPTFFSAMSPGASLESLTAGRQALLSAFRWAGARMAVLEENAGHKASEANPTDATLRTRLSRAVEMTPPLEKLTRAAHGVGLVAYDREPSRGVVRELPMLVVADELFAEMHDRSRLQFRNADNGALIPNLGFDVAMGLLAVDSGHRLIDGNRIIVGNAERRVIFPIDGRGLTLINWHVPPTGRWQDSFTHVSAAKLLEIADLKAAMEENTRRYAIAMGELVRLRFSETPAEYEAYSRLVNERIEVKRQAERKIGDREGLDEGLVRIDEQISATEDDAVTWLRYVWREWKEQSPENAGELEEQERIRVLHEKFGDGGLARETDELNERIYARDSALSQELSPLIANKVCIVAATASAVGDLVASPVYAAMPGVMAHANVINSILQDRIASRAAPVWNLLLLLVGGALTTAASNVRGWRFGLASLIGVSFGVVLVGVWLFWSATIHLATFPALVTIVASWAGVTVYRQSTEEKTRRRLQRALTQYTSPAIANQIADRIHARRPPGSGGGGHDELFPCAAVVTCFFSDLADFTRLSERLGPERTREVLNPYLGAMNRVLVDHGAIVNKFMGDGVFAFFNAPIWPCPDHARQACAAARDAVRAVAELNRHFAETLIDARARSSREADPGVQGPLVVRIGITTGEAFVGDYGSAGTDWEDFAASSMTSSGSQLASPGAKLDYTCIGDTVNVASRLERANKNLGTTVLVDANTRRKCVEEPAFRPLGRLLLHGKMSPVEAFELMVEPTPLDAVTQEFLSLFERAIGHFQRCEWNPCLVALAQCRGLRPNDQAVDLYERTARRLSADTPTHWTGAIPIEPT